MGNRKEYLRAYYQKHKEEHKESMKAWYQEHKEQVKDRSKAHYKEHKEEKKESVKAYRDLHKDEYNEYQKSYMKSYRQADLNSKGQTKNSIRKKSNQVLKRMNLHIDGYEIHHCFGYEDADKFIYISKSLHLKIHEFLRENNIPADSNHWMAIRDIVNSVDEFTYIKC